MIDPMLAAHMQQMRTHAARKRQIEHPAPISRRHLLALAAAAATAVVAGIAAYRPTPRRAPSH